MLELILVKGLSKWYQYNKDIKEGDTVVIKVVESSGKRYKLYKKK